MDNSKAVGWVGNLVLYDGEYWMTLSNFTESRAVGPYSNLASVKSAVRSYSIRINPRKYIPFRGDKPIRDIIEGNKGNRMFNKQELQGHTRTALLHWSLLGMLEDRFPSNDHVARAYDTFKEQAEQYMKESRVKSSERVVRATNETITTKIRKEINQVNIKIQELQKDRERLTTALEVLEGDVIKH